jgi:hypothetical protein
MAQEAPKPMMCGGTSNIKQPDAEIQKIVDDVVTQFLIYLHDLFFIILTRCFI